jgi:hypothetical protein
MLWKLDHLIVALGGAGLLLVGAAPSALANPVVACTSDATALEAACCPRDVLAAYWAERSPQLNQVLCQMLVFPTATLPNAEEFNQHIVDGSLSSDSRRPSPDAKTLPSFWWNRDALADRLGGRRLVQSWISYEIEDSSMAVVDVMVNPQMWSVLNYNERFAVLNQFGTAARDFGYNLRFFQGNARNYRLVGLYACEFAPGTADSEALVPESTAQAATCSANLDSTQIVQIQRQLMAEGDRQPQSAPVEAVAAEATTPAD